MSKVKRYNFSKIKSGIPYLMITFINKGLPLLLLPVFTYYLSPSSFGIVTNFVVSVAIFTVLISWSVNGSILTNYYHYSNIELRKFSSTSFYLVTGTALLVILLIYMLSFIVDYVAYGYSLGILTMAAICSYFDVFFRIQISLYRAEKKLKHFFGIQMLQVLINYGSSLVFIISFQLDYNGRIWGIALSYILIGIISLVYFRIHRFIYRFCSQRYLREIIRFGAPLIPHQLAKWIRNGFDKLIITATIGLSANGVYSFYLQIGLIIYFLVEAINTAFQTDIFKAYQQKEFLYEKERKYSLLLLVSLSVLSVVGYIIFIFIGPYIFEKGYLADSISLLFILLAISLRAANLVTTNPYYYFKQTKLLGKTSTLAAIFHGILGYFMITSFGLKGAALTLIGTESIIFWTNLTSLNKIHAK